MKSKILTLTMLLTCSLSFSSVGWHRCTYFRNEDACKANSQLGCSWQRWTDPRNGAPLAMCAYKGLGQTPMR